MDYLGELREAAARRQQCRDEFDAADAELRRMIREGFAAGFTGDQLAEAAGLSAPRVYQIRDDRR